MIHTRNRDSISFGKKGSLAKRRQKSEDTKSSMASLFRRRNGVDKSVHLTERNGAVPFRGAQPDCHNIGSSHGCQPDC